MWAVLLDDRNQRAVEFFRAIYPKRKHSNGAHSIADEAFNRRISSDRDKVENLFGPLVRLGSFFALKWRYSEYLCNVVFLLVVGLQTYIYTISSYGAKTLNFRARVSNRLSHIANGLLEQRRRYLGDSRNAVDSV